MAYERIRHAGGATPTTLSGSITSGATTMTFDNASDYPATGPFYITVDPGLSTEEKIKVGTMSGNTGSLCTRGVDGTSASAHTAGAVVVHGLTGTEADEANVLVNATLGSVAIKGDLLVASAANALGTLSAGANGLPLVANSAASRGLNYAALAATGIAADAVTTVKLLDANVTAAKLATDSVTTAKILAANVTTAKVADAAVTTVKINDGAVTTAKLNDAGVTAAKFDTALARTFIVADATALAALSGLREGDLAFQADQNYMLFYDGAAWKGIGPNGRTQHATITLATGDSDVNSDPAYATWPTDNVNTVTVPEWATLADVECSIVQCTAVSDDLNFNVRMNVSGHTGQSTRFRLPQNEHDTIVLGAQTFAVTPGSQTFKTQAARVSGTGAIRSVNGETVTAWRYTFKEF